MSDWVEVSAKGGEMHDFLVNKTLEGRYLGKKVGVGANNSNVYNVEITKDGELETASFWGTTVLDSQMQQVPVNARLKVVYKGMAEGKNGRKYKDFSIYYLIPEGEEVVEDDISGDLPF